MKMEKLKPEDLDKISKKMKRIISLREGKGKAKIIVHMGTCGIAAGARSVMNALIEEIEKRDLKDIILTISSCAGFCSCEPMITIELQDEPPVKYANITSEKAIEILENHVLKGSIVKEYALSIGSERVM
jgi:NADP-reducing hydrogenase subunit HndB